jgi:drug/metabolite transporter (DMT)-like permease
MVYSAYVWLVGRAGSVFAAQVSYLVTGFGVLWSMALLGERYSGYVWAALALMFAGLALVQPRPPLAGAGTPADDAERRLGETP